MADFQYSPADQAELAAAFARLADGEEFALGVPSTASDQPVEDPEEEPVPDEEAPDAEQQDDDGEEEVDDEPSDDDATIDLGNGTTLTKAEILELARLRDHFAANPEVAQRLDQTQQYRPQPQQPQPVAAVPAYTPPTPPEELDLDDPTVKFLWEQQQQLHQAFWYQNQELIRRNTQEQIADVERAVSNWNDRYHLDDDQLSKIRVQAAKLNVLGNMTASGISVYDATVNVLEAAFWGDATFREPFLNAQAADNKSTEAQQRTKTRKLGALAGRGTTTSSPKPPSQMSADERREAMVAEIADHLARN